MIPQTVFTLEGFWRLLLGISGLLAELSDVARLSPNLVNYESKSMSPSPLCSETGARELKCYKTQWFWSPECSRIAKMVFGTNKAAEAPFDFSIPPFWSIFQDATSVPPPKNRGRFPTKVWTGDESDPNIRFRKHEIGWIWSRHGYIWVGGIRSSRIQMTPGSHKT